MKLFANEPVAVINALGVLVFAVLTFLINSGAITISADQQDSIKALIGALIALVVTFIGRSQVTPVSKLE